MTFDLTIRWRRKHGSFGPRRSKVRNPIRLSAQLFVDEIPCGLTINKQSMHESTPSLKNQPSTHFSELIPTRLPWSSESFQLGTASTLLTQQARHSLEDCRDPQAFHLPTIISFQEKLNMSRNQQTWPSSMSDRPSSLGFSCNDHAQHEESNEIIKMWQIVTTKAYRHRKWCLEKVKSAILCRGSSYQTVPLVNIRKT